MADDTTDQHNHTNPEETLSPSTHQTPLTARPEPGVANESFDVPTAASSGQLSDASDMDSPESLDEDLSTGTDREDIDPDHSYDRPSGVTDLNNNNGINEDV